MTIHIPERAAQRAYERWEADDNGCHISTYSVGSHGYAQVGWWAGGKSHVTTAHRAAWVHVHGQVTEGDDVDHRPTCDRRCVNLDHLRLLTPQQNRRRNFGDFPLAAGCKRSHPESERVKSKRGMICRLCRNEMNRESYYRVKARKAAA